MQIEKPLVTIGIPTYNRPDGLKHTLTCAINQNYENLEIIVSDNASDDELRIRTIIESFEDPRVKYFRQTENIGGARNFEFLFNNSSGKYIILMPDDDDYYDNNLISSGVESLEENPEASIAYGTVEYIDGEQDVFLIDTFPYKLDGDLEERLSNYLIFSTTDHIMYGLLKTSLVKNFTFIQNLNCSEKLFIWHLLKNGKLIDSPGMRYKNNYTFPLPQKKSLISRIDYEISCCKRAFFLYVEIFKLKSLKISLHLFFLYTIFHAPFVTPLMYKIFGIRRKNYPQKVSLKDPVKTKTRTNLTV